MALTLRVIRRRIRSIQSTAKITRAMEMIATSKMRRAQAQVLSARPYADKITELIKHLAAQFEGIPHPFFEEKEGDILLIHFTPDRGLCGGLPSNLNRSAANFILSQKSLVRIICVGRKGRDFMARTGQRIEAEFLRITDRPTPQVALPIARLVREIYGKGVGRVYLSYARFVSPVVQRPVIESLLPIKPPPDIKIVPSYIYEPRREVLLGELLERFLEMKIYHALLESKASEHSARMIAMRNATQNAEDMIKELTLLANKARQESITKELLDIIGGTWALEGR